MFKSTDDTSHILHPSQQLFNAALDHASAYNDISVVQNNRLSSCDGSLRFIKFHMKDAIPNLFAHWISRDIIAYLRLVSGTGNTRANWLRIMNRPNRYIKREALAPFTSDISVAQLKAYYQDKDWMLERLDRLEYDLSIMKRMSPYAAIHYLSNAMKYQDYLKDYAKEHHINEQELLDVLNAVHESSQSCRTFAEWFTYIDTYTEELQKQAKSPASKDANNESGVCLCTLHCAKGLEYPIVFIPDINEDNIPHARAAVDAGFCEHERQIGQTGTTVRPKLYIACGISGQIQHTAGMEESSMVIAINTDANAPINKFADYVITGDLNVVIPKMIQYYKKNSK